MSITLQQLTRALTAGLLATTGVAALAHGNVSCPAMPKEEKRPQMDLQRKLEADGWKVRQVKNYNNCYEVYGFDAKGGKVEVFFNPKTFERVYPEGEAPGEVIRVWDHAVRSLHWLLAAGVITAWCTGHWPPRWFDTVHHGAGYLAAAVVVVRLGLGLAGGRHARFSQFVRSPRATWAYACALWRGREPRYLGHNPLGGWMVLALLATVAAACASGFAATTDTLWGEAWVTDLHSLLAWLILALVLGHWAGVALTSWRHRENLVAAMLHGRKRPAAEGDQA